MSDPGSELIGRLRDASIDRQGVARFLDSLASAQRIAAVRGLGRSEQRRLYAAVDGFLPLALEDLVPARVPDLATVRHYGRNTLPAFTLPGDTAASARYFAEDLVDPPVVVSADGTIDVPEGPGIGHAIVWPRVERATTYREEWRR